LDHGRDASRHPIFQGPGAGANGSDPHSFILFNNLVYFGAAGALWKSDGTVAGTVIVKSGIEIAELLPWALECSSVRAASLENGSELWVSDGTEAGTSALTQIAPGTTGPTYLGIAPFGDRVLFQGKIHSTDWNCGSVTGPRLGRT